MSVTKKLLAVARRGTVYTATLIAGTVTAMALTYSIYKVLAGQRTHRFKPIKVAHMEEHHRKKETMYPKTMPTIQRFPFDHEPHTLNRNHPQRYPHETEIEEEPTEYLPQPCVTAYTKAHSLFMVIVVKDSARPKDVAAAVARIQEFVKEVEEPVSPTCGELMVAAGVGFGPEFFTKVAVPPPDPSTGGPLLFSNNRQELISTRDVGGDILIHAKANKVEQLEKLAELVLENMPMDSVQWSETIFAVHSNPEEAMKKQKGTEPLTILNYNYVREREQMALFPQRKPVDKKKPRLLFVSDPGLENTEKKRKEAAVDPRTGGSYVMTQKWVHEVKIISHTGEIAMNEWVDKAWEEAAGRPSDRRLRSLLAMGDDLATVSVSKWMNDSFDECMEMQGKTEKLQEKLLTKLARERKDQANDNRKKNAKNGLSGDEAKGGVNTSVSMEDLGHDGVSVMCLPGNPEPLPPFQLLRQAMSFKDNSTGENGLLFVTFAASPRHNEILLDRMIASIAGGGNLNKYSHKVYNLSKNVRSGCWYFPGERELHEIWKRAQTTYE